MRAARAAVLTAATTVVEAIAGLRTGSIALLADGIHMTTLAGASGASPATRMIRRRLAATSA